MNKFAVIFLTVIFILFIWSFFIEPNLLVVTKYKINKFDGKKIVFVSDFHYGKNAKWRLKKLVKLINKQNPDLVLSGGDFVNGYDGNHTLDIHTYAEELSKINAPVITVLGNHDSWFDKFTIKNALENRGIKVLLNSNTIASGIYIAGVEDLQTGVPRADIALENTEFPRILISHSPDIYYDVKDDVDLILAGHVHGGQVRMPFYGALLVPSIYGKKFACGIFNETGNTMIVTKGLGNSILNVRFNAIPEIVVIE